MWYTDTMKYYSDIIKNEITLFAVTIDGPSDYHTK